METTEDDCLLTSSNVDEWPSVEPCQRCVEDWDDGHIPENLALVHDDDENAAAGSSSSSRSSNRSKLVTYPAYHRNRPGQVMVFDDAGDENLVNDLYNVTAVSGSKPWGTYVNMRDVLACWKKKDGEEPRGAAFLENAASSSSLSPLKRQDLAVAAVSCFLKNSMCANKRPSMFRCEKRHRGNGGFDDDDDDDTSCNDNHRIDHEAMIDNRGGGGRRDGDGNEEDDRDGLPLPLPQPKLWSEGDLSNAHGVAVWALAADANSRVAYHLDYAEQVRYQTNVICPPVLAGTLQCTRSTVHGGDFCIHMAGLEHYKQHGYKGAKTTKKMLRRHGDVKREGGKVNGGGGGSLGGESEHERKEEKGEQQHDGYTVMENAGDGNDNDNNEHILLEGDDDWFRIPYKYNRMICASGQLPHLSTRVCSVDDGQMRVIVGFNVFLRDIGPWVERVPEHSAAFRRITGLQRWFWRNRRQRQRQNGGGEEEEAVEEDLSRSGGRGAAALSLREIRRDPAVAKLLVLAKREKVKRDLVRAQQELERNIRDALLLPPLSSPGEGEEGTEAQTTVRDLMERFGCRGGNIWPSPTDVQVFLFHKWKDGKLRVHSGDSDHLGEQQQTSSCCDSPKDLHVICPHHLVSLPPT